MARIFGDVKEIKGANHGRSSRADGTTRQLSRVQFNEIFPKKDIIRANRKARIARKIGHNASSILPAHVELQRELAKVKVLTPSKIPTLNRYSIYHATRSTGTQIANGYIDRRRAKWAVGLAAAALLGGHALFGGGDQAPPQAAGNVSVGSTAAGSANKAPIVLPTTAKTETKSASASQTIKLAAGRVICSANNPAKVVITGADKIGSAYSPLAAMERVAGTPQGGDFSYTNSMDPTTANAFWKDVSTVNHLPSANTVSLGETLQVPINCSIH